MRSHHPVARLCAAAVLFASANAGAQELSLTGGAQGDAEKHPAGVYAGVKPGGDERPFKDVKPGGPPVITWPGFQMRPDGSSRVFVQLTAPVDTSAARVDGKVIVDFGDTKIDTTTNRLPIYPRFFNTPVTSIELKRSKKRTTLELTLRAPLEPRISSETASSGYYFVYLDFPSGDFLPKDAQRNVASAPPPPPKPENAPPEPPGTNSASFQASGSASANASLDTETPPGMGKVKASGKAKASGKVKGKASLSF